jgi:dephospho-CoA kinase
MGVRNYLIEGVSGVGKTSVCHELRRRGFHAINGDTDLAYQGDPETGAPTEGLAHEHHIWDLAKVRALVADHSRPASFFCGGSRNFHRFIELFDRVFVLEVDWDTLNGRLAARGPTEWGGRPAERRLVQRLHATKEDTPRGDVIIDATAPLGRVVDEILAGQVQAEGS